MFPFDELLDERACYNHLLKILHPEGMHCPNGHPLPADQAPHNRRQAPRVTYRCRVCGQVFSLFTGTL